MGQEIQEGEKERGRREMGGREDASNASVHAQQLPVSSFRLLTKHYVIFHRHLRTEIAGSHADLVTSVLPSVCFSRYKASCRGI